MLGRVNGVVQISAEICVAVQWDDRIYYASSRSFPDHSENTRVEVGCIAKTLTAVLVAHAVQERQLSLDTVVGELLSDLNRSHERICSLSGIRVRHLLNHTHGLDCAHLRKLPQIAGGFIDSAGLLNEVARNRPIAEPGTIVDYGNVGPWIAACVLERLYSQPYPSLLKSLIEDRFGLSGGSIDACNACPAMGGGLRLSAGEFLRLARHLWLPYGSPDETGALIELRTRHPFALPRLPAFGKYMCLGLMEFGPGWFGHNGRAASSSALLRFEPSSKLSIVITTPYPYLAPRALDQLLNPIGISQTHEAPRAGSTVSALGSPSEYIGLYVNSVLTVEITASSPTELTASITRRLPSGNSGPRWERVLMRKTFPHTFVPMQAKPNSVRMLHFSHHDDAHKFRFLNTGLCILRRIGAGDSDHVSVQ